MSTIPINYSDTGFNPSSVSAAPTDTLLFTNDLPKDSIEMSFSCPSTSDPLDGMTSPTQIEGGGGTAEGRIRNAASNHTITFTANSFECLVDVGPATHEIEVYSDHTMPLSMNANVDDFIPLQNETSNAVTIEVHCEGVSNPLGPEVGEEHEISGNGHITGQVARAAKGKKIKVTVQGSTSEPTTINVGSGDTETVQSRSQQQTKQY